MTPAEGPVAATRFGTAVVRGLSGRRRAACRLTLTGPAGFHTDLRDVWMPWPLPTEIAKHPGSLAGCLAMQASPTKDVVASLSARDFTPRLLAALQLCEGAAAVGWVADRWPGMLDDVVAVTGVQPAPWEGVSSAELAERARALVRGTRGEIRVPVAFGFLPLTVDARGWWRAALLRLMSTVPAIEAWLGRHVRLILIPSAGGAEHDGRSPEGRALSDGGDWASRPMDDAFPYPEWDEHAQGYRDDYVHVRERDVDRGSLAPRPPRRDLDAWFSAPIDRRWSGRLRQGADIDIDAAVDALLDLKTGGTPSDHLYRDRVQVERDVAFGLLIDCSGSVGQDDLLQHELECADALVDAMDRAGEKHAVFGFSSNGRHAVTVDVVQDFDDAARRPTSARLRSQNYTRLGGALRHVTARVLDQSATRHSVLVLSDAVPFDEGYEGHYASADVAKAIEEAERLGVVVTVLGVGEPLGDAGLDLLNESVISIARVDDLARAIGDTHARLAC